MRRCVVVLVLLLAACSGGGGTTRSTEPPTSVSPAAHLPAAVRAFVAQVADPGTTPFRASYRVLRKLGGGEDTVDVLSEPPRWRITAGSIVVVGGRDETTCDLDRHRCYPGIREALLTPVGVFSTFFATAPARSLATDARRTGAAAPVASNTTVAGVALRCLAVPVDGATPATYCLTPEGVFGLVDTPAVHYELLT